MCHFEDEIKSKRRNKIDLHFQEATWKGSKIHRCQLIIKQITIQVQYKHGEYIRVNIKKSPSIEEEVKSKRRNKIYLHFQEATWKGSKIHRCQLIILQITIQVKYKHGREYIT